MNDEKKAQAQIAAIESACRRLGITYDELAARLITSPETMRKWRFGYQAMGQKTLRLLETLTPANEKTQARSEPRVLPTPAPQSPRSEASTILEQVEEILNLATFAEQTAFRAMVSALHRVVTTRAPAAPAAELPKPAVLPGPHHVVPLHTFNLPLHGYIAAGVPGDGGEAGAMYVAVPVATKGVDFAVKVHGDSMIEAGIHHGDILLMNRREPKNGDVVAARVDGEYTLKRYQLHRGKVSLVAANQSFTKPITTWETMQVVGVMVGKL